MAIELSHRAKIQAHPISQLREIIDSVSSISCQCNDILKVEIGGLGGLEVGHSGQTVGKPVWILQLVFKLETGPESTSSRIAGGVLRSSNQRINLDAVQIREGLVLKVVDGGNDRPSVFSIHILPNDRVAFEIRRVGRDRTVVFQLVSVAIAVNQT